MTEYNVEVREYMHSGATKDYHVILVTPRNDATASAMVLRRWGSVGSAGQLKTSFFPGNSSALNDADKEHRNRISSKKDYRQTNTVRTTWGDKFKLDLVSGLHHSQFIDRLYDELEKRIGVPVSVTSQPEPAKLDETVDRGEAWGSW